MKYKTEICKNWETTGHCEFENSCSFAHGMDELKVKTDVPKNYKTKPCKRYHKQMYCPYGARCQFLHGELHQIESKPLLAESIAIVTQSCKKNCNKVSKKQSSCNTCLVEPSEKTGSVTVLPELSLYNELRRVNFSRPMNGRL